MSSYDLERDIKETLKNILRFIGVSEEWAEYAQLQDWLEQLIERHR